MKAPCSASQSAIDVAQATRRELVACRVGQPGRDVLVVGFGRVTDGCRELGVQRHGQTFNGHDLRSYFVIPMVRSTTDQPPIESDCGDRYHGPPYENARPRQDSNLRTRLRRPMLYPLSYEGGAGSG